MGKRRFLTIGGYAPPKHVSKMHPESQAERDARAAELMREAAEPTGFDILLENKERGLRQMRELLKAEPSLTRTQLSMRLKLSMRTVYRYMRIIREGQGIKTTAVDVEVAKKAGRVAKLQKLMKEHPEYSRTQLAEKVGVSRKTLYDYLLELGLL